MAYEVKIHTLSPKKIEANRKRYQAMVGKAVTLMVTGAEVKGTVKEFKEDEHGFDLVIEHEPVRWGKDTYTIAYCFARKIDDWGSLNNVKLV